MIPFHNETPEQLMRLLASVNNQVGVNFGQIDVQLIGDGITDWDLTQYQLLANLTVRFYGYADSLGAGYARQAGLQRTSGRYVMFLDADDVLQSVFALKPFFDAVSHGNHEVIIARYLQQARFPDGMHYIPSHPHDWKSPVAKWFNREYLEAHDLKWHPELRIFEDTYFVGLACELASDIVYLDDSVYVWLWNPRSTVRKDNRAFDHQLDEWAKSHRFFFETMRKQAPQYVARDFYGYMADLFFHELKFPPADDAAFDREQKKLLAENRGLWGNPNSHDQVTAIAQKLSEQADGDYHGMALDGIDAFLQKQDKLLYQAFLEAQSAPAGN
ncbi:hypothetical protein FD02_GL001623 [Lacticaseibacillus nasuensis JCM 17158]|uniref:Glycosyltransferase 2-like domain-containing protein n=1 Tax=Lacticaseibacillus nasuensis JCM 17158 TaxID=1291734 RepID=A0A0R1JXR2_9LACO|nr:hypothetical protein FD02_GL001623 [Lacticaseibacillus nasuensis JCM 17158]